MLVILVKTFHEQPINEVHIVSFTCLYSKLSSSLESECVKYLDFSPWELSSSLDNKVEDLHFR